jgi:hypothetical protein
MDKNKNAFPLTLLLSTISGFVWAAEIPDEGHGKQAAAAVASEYPGRTPYHSVKTVYSDCQRHSVVWSGGIARRGPDRITPRPVRSRWQDADDNRIFCTGGNPFSQKRVADTPWIR